MATETCLVDAQDLKCLHICTLQLKTTRDASLGILKWNAAHFLQHCSCSTYKRRMAVRTGRRDHIRPTLKRLHWLLIRQRIVYKALVLTFRGLHGLAPKYISVLLRRYVPSRHLRSGGSMDVPSCTQVEWTIW